VPPLPLTLTLRALLPGLSRESQAILGALVAANGGSQGADLVARQVGLGNRFRLARRLASDGLPPFGELADWVSLLHFLWQSENTGGSLLRVALKNGLEPATCYRRCRRTLGVPWRAARARGFAWGVSRFLERCARRRRASDAPLVLPSLNVARALDRTNAPPSVRRPGKPRPAPEGASTREGPAHPRGVVAYHLQVPDAPTDIAVSVAGVIYVTRAFAARVDRLDLRTRATIASIPVGANPTRLAFDPTGRVAYVTNQFDDSVSVIDVAAGKSVEEIPVAGDPAPILASPDGRYVFVSTNHDELIALSVTARRVTARLPLPATSHQLVRHPQAPCLYLSTRSAGTVMEVGIPTLQPRRTFEVGGQTQAMVVAPDGAELYVADEAGAVHVINLESGRLAATIHLSAPAYGLDLTPDGAQLFVTMPTEGRVHLLDRQSRRMAHTVVTGGMPRHTAFTRDGLTGLIVNEAGWVTVVW